MSSDQLEHGADLRRQFKKTVIQAGYLKGARYLDVGLEDLKKAARSYRGEPRFNQFAKRALAEKLLAQDEPQSAERPVVDPPSGHLAQFFGRVCMLFRWLGSKFKGRTVLALCILGRTVLGTLHFSYLLVDLIQAPFLRGTGKSHRSLSESGSEAISRNSDHCPRCYLGRSSCGT